MSFYARQQSTALRLLEKFGQAGAIRRSTLTGGGASDREGGTESATDHPARLAVFPVQARDADGTTIQVGDWQVLVAAKGLDVDPRTTDKVVCSEGVLTIIDTGKLAPDGTPVIYDMVCRNG